MIHRKLTHSEKVQFCAHFSEGKCDFKDSCWFSHDISKRKDLPEYKCNVCEKVFRIQSAFMKHRRKEHNRHVPICRDSKNGCCQYGIENCWFSHVNENNEILNLNTNSHENMNGSRYENQNEMMQII